MKRSRSLPRRTRRALRTQRHCRLEGLEDRRLLTVIDPGYFGSANEFTVRRDEAAPVELDIVAIAAEGSRGLVPIEVIEPGTGTVTLTGSTDQDPTPNDNDASEVHHWPFDNWASDNVSYQPAPGFVGVDIFTVGYVDPAVTVGEDETPVVTEVRIAVNVVEPLLAVRDWFFVDANQTDDVGDLQFDVLENDIQNARYIGQVPELVLSSVETEGSGSVSIHPESGLLVYTPESGFTGLETIRYTAVDADGYSIEGLTQVRVANEPSDTLWPEQLQQELEELAVRRNQHFFGAGTSLNGFYRALDYLVPGFDFEFQTSDTTVADVSGTNNQIAGVDESDRIKTNGEFLFVLSSPEEHQWNRWGFLPFIDFVDFDGTGVDDTQAAAENMLSIVDIRQPDNPMIVSRQALADKVMSLDLHDDRLTVISQRDARTVVTVLDITDATDAKTISTTVVDGKFKQARRVGSSLYVFTESSSNRIPDVQSLTVNDGDFSFYETGDDYLSRVKDSLIAYTFPSQDVYDGDGNAVSIDTLMVDPLQLGILHDRNLNIITLDTSLDVGGASDWDVNEGGNTVLVTAESIYVTETKYQHDWSFANNAIPAFNDIPEHPSVATEIDRYEINDNGSVKEVANGYVPGTLKNSFSLDEYDGYLRIATENRWSPLPGGGFGSNVYVLQQSDDQLNTVGAVSGLAPGESIYAVRFAGDRGYVVTFRQVDPLFVVDLSDPTAPTVQGELKVPGYSQYLHVISENHVLGVGREADPDTGLYQGLSVSLFDVSDPMQPALQDRYVFDGGRSTFSPFGGARPWEVEDHHAISYFAGSSVLALPFYSRNSFSRSDSDEPIFSGDQSAVRTFQIDTENGISVLDTISFDSRADRTLRVGQHLYSLSAEQLKVTNLLQPDGVVASLEFEREGADDFVDVPLGENILLDVLENDGIDDSVVEILAASIIDGEGKVEIVDNQLQFTQSSRRLTPHRVQYTARNAAGTLIDAFATIDPDLDWQNDRNRFDINGDGDTTPLDILNLINSLADHGVVSTEEIEATINDVDTRRHFYVDTNGDKSVSPLDVLQVINFLDVAARSDVALAGFELGAEFELAAGDVATLNSGDVQIALLDVVEDSRCPSDSTCVWEGRVKANLNVTTGGDTSAVQVVLQAGEESVVHVGEISIQLVDVTPEQTLENLPLEHVLTLLVNEI